MPVYVTGHRGIAQYPNCPLPTAMEHSGKDLAETPGRPGSIASPHKHRHRHHHHHHHHHHNRNRASPGVDSGVGGNAYRRPALHSRLSGRAQERLPQHPSSSLKLPRLADGTRFGNYQIVKTLGTGSFGKVKLAYHVTTGQKVALKVINKRILSRRDMQGRVEREISYLRLLRHPHIIKLYDVIKSRDEIIIVLEYAEHELFEYITTRGRLDEDDARRFFQEIISAVEYCHRHKVAHRDLKPENLLLDKNYRVKITDFGLSNIMTDGNFLKTSCGSPNYAAPEIIGGKLYAGPEVDVWSCGVILYVLLCHRLPFDSESLPELFRNISNGIYALPTFLSPAAASLIQRMLIVNPLGRISIQEIMQDPWFKVDIPLYLVPQDLRKPMGLEGDDDDTDSVSSLRGDEPIDDELVTALANTMGYEIDEIYEALQTTRDDPGLNEIRDAYLLVRENKAILRDLEVVRSDSDISLVNNKSGTVIDTIAAQQLPSYHTEREERYSLLEGPPQQQSRQNSNRQQRTYNDTDSVALDTNASTITILPTSLPQIHRVNMFAKGVPGAGVINPMLTQKSHSRWHFGIRSHSYPLVVMGELYAALKHLGAYWTPTKERELWTIRAKWKWDPSHKMGETDDATSDDDARGPIPEELKVVIQLFQTTPGNYLVDLRFDGWEIDDDDDDDDGAMMDSGSQPGSRRSTPSSTREATPTAESIARDEKISTFSAYPFLNLASRLINELVKDNEVPVQQENQERTEAQLEQDSPVAKH